MDDELDNILLIHQLTETNTKVKEHELLPKFLELGCMDVIRILQRTLPKDMK